MYRPDVDIDYSDDVPCAAELKQQEYEIAVEGALKGAFLAALDQAYSAYEEELRKRGLDLPEEESDRIDVIFEEVMTDLEERVEGITFNA